MTSSSSSGTNPIWYCVLDDECRLLYLGTNETEATVHDGPGKIVAHAARMGDAMSRAAMMLAGTRSEKR